MMKHIPLIMLSLLFFASCQRKVSSKKDYIAFLSKSPFQQRAKANADEIKFWETKLLSDTGSYVYKFELAQHLISRFHISANPVDLKIADSLLINSLTKTGGKEAAIYYTLVQNAILQHQFKEANIFLQQLNYLGGEPFIIKLLSFDVLFEQGKYFDASNILNELGNKKQSFDYLIRHAKLLDQQGNSAESLNEMEQAYQVALKKGKSAIINWCLTNLADMYSHAGKLEKAYKYYLTALQRDSSNLNALNGIAKIAYLHDEDFDKAKEIILFSQQVCEKPENFLLLAQIEELSSNIAMKEKNEALFLDMLSQKNYGNMYNKYLIEILLSKPGKKSEALNIASGEIGNRATPETYSWLAYSLFENGKTTEAVQLIQKEVLGKTFEPESLFLAGVVLNKNNKAQSESCLKECLNSQFELGPHKFKVVKSLLKG